MKLAKFLPTLLLTLALLTPALAHPDEWYSETALEYALAEHPEFAAAKNWETMYLSPPENHDWHEAWTEETQVWAPGQWVWVPYQGWPWHGYWHYIPGHWETVYTEHEGYYEEDGWHRHLTLEAAWGFLDTGYAYWNGAIYDNGAVAEEDWGYKPPQKSNMSGSGTLLLDGATETYWNGYAYEWNPYTFYIPGHKQPTAYTLTVTGPGHEYTMQVTVTHGVKVIYPHTWPAELNWAWTLN